MRKRAEGSKREDVEEVEEDLVDLLARQSTPRPPRIDGVAIGKLAALDAAGAPLVDFPENFAGAPVRARSTVPATPDDVGREAALLFEDGDAGRPILVGFLVRPAPIELAPASEQEAAPPSEALVDGERVVLTARDEIVLRCGRASITLTRAGKILIRGAYLLSRSSGVNRIKGGSVQIN